MAWLLHSLNVSREGFFPPFRFFGVFYGKYRDRVFGYHCQRISIHFGRIARFNLFALVLFWFFALAGSLNAEIFDDDLTPIYELLQGIESYSKSISDSVTTSYNDSVINELKDINSSTSDTEDLLRKSLGYYEGSITEGSVSLDMDSILAKLDEIKTLLASSSGGGSVTNAVPDLSIFGWDRYLTQRSYFEEIFGNSFSWSFENLSDVSLNDGYFEFNGMDLLRSSNFYELVGNLGQNVTWASYFLNNNLVTGFRNVVSAIKPDDSIWEGDPSELKDSGANENIFKVQETGGSSSSSSWDYTPGLTNDLSVVQVAINDNTNRLYMVSSYSVAGRYLRDPFGEVGSSSSVDDVEAEASPVIDFGHGIVIDFSASYDVFNENVMAKIKDPVKTGFGYLWTLAGILGVAFALRKVVSGGV